MFTDDNTAEKSIGSITFQPFASSDVQAVVDEYERTWGWGQNASRADAAVSSLLSRYVVLDYLRCVTRGDVASQAGRFMGVTFTRVDGEPPAFPDAGELMRATAAQLNADEQGAAALRGALRWNRLKEQLELGGGVRESTQAELLLFLVASGARGRGIGVSLWRRLMGHLAAHGVQRYYLHTDSSSDVGYYDHQGLTCVASRFASDHNEGEGQVPHPTDDFFIYVGDTNSMLVHEAGDSAGSSIGLSR